MTFGRRKTSASVQADFTQQWDGVTSSSKLNRPNKEIVRFSLNRKWHWMKRQSTFVSMGFNDEWKPARRWRPVCFAVSGLFRVESSNHRRLINKEYKSSQLEHSYRHLSNRNLRQDIDTHSNPILFSGRRRSFKLGPRNAAAHFFLGFVVLPNLSWHRSAWIIRSPFFLPAFGFLRWKTS